jgi:hypothetical protein
VQQDRGDHHSDRAGATMAADVVEDVDDGPPSRT